MNHSYLLLWLESPLQSWGFDSKFGRRDTLNFPTKSGVLGLICCALGARGEQREFLKNMADLSMSVISFLPEATPDHEVVLRDFHMVGSGYDKSDPWEKSLIPKTNKGTPAVGGGSKMTYRYYLQNSYFAVVLEAPQALAEKIAEALQNPVWDLYLGRKNCVPTDFIYRGLFHTESESLEMAVSISQEKKLLESFRVINGEEREKGEVLILNDVPIQFGERKQYRDRYVTVIGNDRS